MVCNAWSRRSHSIGRTPRGVLCPQLDPHVILAYLCRDEDNLEKNEKIKAELNPRKIDEPKTPYLSPLETSDEDHDMLDGGDAGGLSPLSLDDDGQPRVRSRPLRNSAWSDSDQASPSPHTNNTHVSHSPRFSEEYYRNGSDDENSDDPEVIEKRRKFKEARNAHYKMEFMPM